VKSSLNNSVKVSKVDEEVLKRLLIHCHMSICVIQLFRLRTEGIESSLGYLLSLKRVPESLVPYYRFLLAVFGYSNSYGSSTSYANVFDVCIPLVLLEDSAPTPDVLQNVHSCKDQTSSKVSVLHFFTEFCDSNVGHFLWRHLKKQRLERTSTERESYGVRLARVVAALRSDVLIFSVSQNNRAGFWIDSFDEGPVVQGREHLCPILDF
jgi:hypothetical protein